MNELAAESMVGVAAGPAQAHSLLPPMNRQSKLALSSIQAFPPRFRRVSSNIQEETRAETLAEREDTPEAGTVEFSGRGVSNCPEPIWPLYDELAATRISGG